jgi:hypothetical protein
MAISSAKAAPTPFYALTTNRYEITTVRQPSCLLRLTSEIPTDRRCDEGQ